MITSAVYGSTLVSEHVPETQFTQVAVVRFHVTSAHALCDHVQFGSSNRVALLES